MLNSSVINFLKSVQNITNTIVLRYPLTCGISENGACAFYMDISEIDSEKFPDINLNNNLSDFLNVFSLFSDNRTVKIQDNVATVSEGKMSSQFILSDPVLIKAPFNKDPAAVQAYDKMPSIAKIDFTADTMQKIKKASSVFKDLPVLMVQGKDDVITVQLTSASKFNAHSNTFSLEFDSRPEKEFKVNLPVEALFNAPVTDYTLEIKYNSTNNVHCFFLKSKKFTNFAVIIAVTV